jgi:hypothetical protein
MFALLALWLFSSLYFVNMEFDDGYATIANSQHFLGISDGYFWQRGPLFALLLLPAEWFANAAGLHPLNVRPHHAIMALLHLAYLFGVWRLLVTQFGTRWNVLLAYVAAVPTFLFFSYAPFISHDLFPGLLALWMLKIAHDFMANPTWQRWGALVAIGAVAVLIKQTYALIWFALFIANAIVWLWGEPDRRQTLRRLAALAAGGLTCGVITWCVYAWTLMNSFDDTQFLLGPWVQILKVAEHVNLAGPVEQTMYRALYFRNLSAYGFLAMALVLPGLFLSFTRGARLSKSIAIAWVLLVITMQLIQFKEVRYLGFLAPLTAVLIVSAIDALLRFRRSYAYVLLLVLAIDLRGVVIEAVRLTDPYYREEITTFLSPLPRELTAPIVISKALSFVSHERYAFFADRYHRITNMIGDEIRLLYGYPQSLMQRFETGGRFDIPPILPGTIVFFVNETATRRPPFRADKTGLDAAFAQLLSVAELVTLERVGDRYRLVEATSQPVMLLHISDLQAQPLTALQDFPADEVDALRGISGAPARIQLLGLRIKQYCNLDGCRSYP